MPPSIESDIANSTWPGGAIIIVGAAVGLEVQLAVAAAAATVSRRLRRIVLACLTTASGSSVAGGSLRSGSRRERRSAGALRLERQAGAHPRVVTALEREGLESVVAEA